MCFRSWLELTHEAEAAGTRARATVVVFCEGVVGVEGGGEEGGEGGEGEGGEEVGEAWEGGEGEGGELVGGVWVREGDVREEGSRSMHHSQSCGCEEAYKAQT